MSHLTNFDAALNLELAEHAWLMSLGWRWMVVTDWKGTKLWYAYGGRPARAPFPAPFPEGQFVWLAPVTHKGSSRYYTSRAHAINSVKKYYPINDLVGRDNETYGNLNWRRGRNEDY